jgi:hypothetical protein
MLKNIKTNKKAQIQSIIFFAGLVLMLLIAAPIIMKMTNQVLGKFGTSLASSPSTNLTAATGAVTKVQTVFTTSFDWIIMFLLLFNIVLLLITAFLVDVHPAFLIIYIIALVFLFIFAPMILDAVTNIWDYMDAVAPSSPSLQTYMPMVGWVKDHYTIFILGIAILSGIIMYGKFRLSAGSSGGSTAYY